MRPAERAGLRGAGYVAQGYPGGVEKRELEVRGQ